MVSPTQEICPTEGALKKKNDGILSGGIFTTENYKCEMSGDMEINKAKRTKPQIACIL